MVLCVHGLLSCLNNAWLCASSTFLTSKPYIAVCLLSIRVLKGQVLARRSRKPMSSYTFSISNRQVSTNGGRTVTFSMGPTSCQGTQAQAQVTHSHAGSEGGKA